MKLMLFGFGFIIMVANLVFLFVEGRPKMSPELIFIAMCMLGIADVLSKLEGKK